MWQLSLISFLLLSGVNASPNCNECSPVNNCCSLCTNLTCKDITNTISGVDNCVWIEELDIGHGRCRSVSNDSIDSSGSISDTNQSGENLGSGVS